MIDAELRKAVAALAKRGMSAREISRRLKISRNTVRAIIAQDGKANRRERKDKIPLDRELLAQLYADCGGYAQRVHEKLVEEYHVVVEYPTLTRRRPTGRRGHPTRGGWSSGGSSGASGGIYRRGSCPAPFVGGGRVSTPP